MVKPEHIESIINDEPDYKAKYEQVESALQNILGYLPDFNIIPPESNAETKISDKR